MKMSKYEQETIINYNQEEDLAHCFTYDPALIRKLDKLSQKSSTLQLSREGNGYKEYTFPKKWVKVQIPRQVSEEMRQTLADRARKNFWSEKDG